MRRGPTTKCGLLPLLKKWEKEEKAVKESDESPDETIQGSKMFEEPRKGSISKRAGGQRYRMLRMSQRGTARATVIVTSERAASAEPGSRMQMEPGGWGHEEGVRPALKHGSQNRDAWCAPPILYIISCCDLYCLLIGCWLNLTSTLKFPLATATKEMWAVF